jgi:lysophospholipase L1-like esterase
VTVRAGRSRTVVGTGTVTLDGRVTGNAVSTTWTMLSGPARAQFAADTPQTTVTVPAPGSYTFQLTATDRAGRSRSSQTSLTVLRFVALGDSYSSGDGAGPIADYLPGTYLPFGGCRRSRDAYPALVDTALIDAALADAALVDAALATRSPGAPAATKPNPLFTFGACARARTADVSAPQRPGVPPQDTYLDGPAGTVGLVTLTLGGNDIGFADITAYCAALRVTTLLPSCRDHSEPAEQAALVTLKPHLTQAYQTIKKAGSLVPRARVLALGYPRLFPRRLTAPCPVSVLGNLGVRIQPADAAWLNQVVHDLNGTIRAAAAEAGVTYVNTEDAFAGHEFCNSQGNPAYINPLGMPFAAAFHPNGPGHHALATEVTDTYRPAAR